MSDFGIEHTADSECINIHSDKDISVYAVHDRKTDILHDDIETITNNRSVTVAAGKSDFSVNTGPHTETVKGAVSETFDDTQTTTVTKEIVIESATAHIHIHGCTIIQLDAGDQIKLISGDSSITLNKDGTIEISGKKITIAGTEETSMGVGNQNVKCDKTQVGTSGAAINSSATGKHEISGAVVKIN